MSKKHPSPIEDRWRWHWRRKRLLAKVHDDRNIGDPLGIVTRLRRSGAVVHLEIAVQDEAEFFARHSRASGCHH